MILVKPSFKILTPDINFENMLQHIEAAGRTCYKSEDKITKDSAEIFVKSIIKRGHESVIEHESISVRFICDRGVSHELVRHRLASFSQESTRYCDYNKKSLTFIIPSWVNIEPGEYKEYHMTHNLTCDSIWYNAMLDACKYYKILRENNWTPQQARSVLPNSLKTEVVMTANLREWRLIFKQRASSGAHEQMREIMIPLLNILKEKLPCIFNDII